MPRAHVREKLRLSFAGAMRLIAKGFAPIQLENIVTFERRIQRGVERREMKFRAERNHRA